MKKGKIPEDFLLNPELIDEFLGMFESKIEFMEGELEKTENIRKQIKANIDQLKDKHNIMSKYQQFIKGKGFGHMKQTVDEHFKNMKEADTNRIQAPKYCKLPYEFMGKRYNCLKSREHEGDCGVV